MSTSVDPLEQGHEALGRAAWAEARSRFEAALAAEESPEALEGLGVAAWWLEDSPATIDARRRAYRLYRARGDQRGAARAAIGTPAGSAAAVASRGRPGLDSADHGLGSHGREAKNTLWGGSPVVRARLGRRPACCARPDVGEWAGRRRALGRNEPSVTRVNMIGRP